MRKEIEFNAAYESSRKSRATAYLLWFFFGAHYAYLNKWLPQIILWGLWVWFISSMIGLTSAVGTDPEAQAHGWAASAGLSFFGLLIAGVWMFVDLFRISGMVNRYNARKRTQLADALGLE